MQKIVLWVTIATALTFQISTTHRTNLRVERADWWIQLPLGGGAEWDTKTNVNVLHTSVEA